MYIRRVKSQPNILCCASPNLNYIHTVIDSVIVSKVPISQSLTCIITHKFPDDLLDPNKDFVSCLMMPSDNNKKTDTEIIEQAVESGTRNRLRRQKHRASTG